MSAQKWTTSFSISKRPTVFPHIVSSLEYFPPLNSFLTSVRKLFKFLLHKGKIIEETIWNFQGLKIPKNYMRKYGTLNLHCCSSKNKDPLRVDFCSKIIYRQIYFIWLLLTFVQAVKNWASLIDKNLVQKVIKKTKRSSKLTFLNKK